MLTSVLVNELAIQCDNAASILGCLLVKNQFTKKKISTY